MAVARKKRRSKKRKTRGRSGKIKVTQKAEIRQKNDTTKIDTAKSQIYRDNGANFKITIKKK